MMRNLFVPALLCLSLLACKTGNNADKKFDVVEGENAYRLVLKPDAGTEFHYDITNETEMIMEVQGKEMENLNRSTVGVNYVFGSDSNGAILMDILYDKIQLYTKNDKAETEMDAANAAVSINPAEKMLGSLIESKLSAIVTATGELKAVRGYDEMMEKILAGFGAESYDRKAMKDQLEKTIGQGIIKKSMSDLFSIFPDSLVKVGDKWKLSSREQGDIGMNVQTTYVLKKIDNGMAEITSEGVVRTEEGESPSFINGAMAKLNGSQHGEYKIDISTGMMLTSKISSAVKGIVITMGREIPVEIRTSIRMNGSKKK